MDTRSIATYFASPTAFPWSEVLRDLDAIGESFRLRTERLSAMNGGPVPDLPGVVIRGQVRLGQDCTIDPFVLIEGPVWIGNRVHIRSGALIRPGTVLGDDVVVGHAAEVKNAHVARGAKLQSNVFVGDSILGQEVRIGSGTILANRRFDQADIVLDLPEGPLVTNRDKLGAIIGDRTRFGANATTAPGTVVGPDCLVYSAASIAGFVPPRSIVKLRQSIEIVARRGETFTLKSRDAEGSL